MSLTAERVRVAPWRFFDAEVRAVTRRSPTFVRLTVTGHDLDRFVDLGYDARVKLVLPHPTGGYARLPRGVDWFPRWRALDPGERPGLRTYTTRAVRPERREVDIDVAVHGDLGLATSWVQRAAPGDPVVLLGPDADAGGPYGGVEFTAPRPHDVLLLAGDETAVPAITNILRQLPESVRGSALLEVPESADWHDVPAPPGMTVVWLARRGRAHGEVLRSALHQHTRRATRAWVAGEAQLVRALRHHLVSERGVVRDQVRFMAYWKRGAVGG